MIKARLTAALLAVVILASCFSTTVYARSESAEQVSPTELVQTEPLYSFEGYSFAADGESAELVSFSGEIPEDGSLLVPEVFTANGSEYTAASIRSGAFSSLEGLIHVLLPECTLRLDASAFIGCENLETVTVSQKAEVSKDVFEDCPKAAVLFYDPVSSVTPSDAEVGSPSDIPKEVTASDTAPYVELAVSSTTLRKGESVQINAAVLPESVSDRSLSYFCSDTDIIEVSEAGLVTALKGGSAAVTVANTGSGASAVFSVKVLETPESFTLPSTLNLTRGVPYTLSPAFSPDSANERGLTYKSSSTVAYVSADGVITPRKIGSCTITVTSTANRALVRKVKVYVRRPVSSLTRSFSSKTVKTGSKTKLKVTALPYNAYVRKLKYSSSDPAIANVSAAGNVYAFTPGVCYITATTTDGTNISTRVKFTVKQPVTSISVFAKTRTVCMGTTYNIGAFVNPANASNPALTYTSSNKYIATVSSKGVVTPKHKGTCYITVRAKDGSGKYRRVKITVVKAATSMKLSASSQTIYQNLSYAISVSFSPSGTSSTLTYSSSDPSIAKVSSGGVVTGVSPGTAVITVHADNGLIPDAKLNVTVKFASLSLNAAKIPVKTGGTWRINPKLTTGVPGVSLVYMSSNEAVATVSQTGVITGVSDGSAVITVMTDNALVKATIAVYVSSDILTHGIDVSTHNGSLSLSDWKKIKEDGNDFAIIRAGYGRYASQKDARFEQNYKNAKQAGLDVGVYHYSYAKTVAQIKTEADVMISWLEGKQFEYPIILDIEDPSQTSLGKPLTSQMVDAYCKKLQDAGYYVQVYSYASYLQNKIYASTLSQYDVWVAHLDVAAPTTIYNGDYTMWQYCHSGLVNGISGRVDQNVCYVDYPSIIKSQGKNGYELPVVSESDL